MRTDPAALRRWLRERIEAIEVGSTSQTPVLATGWPRIDEALPGGGLRRGAVHEWFGLETHASEPPAMARSQPKSQPWTPPLSILTHLAHRAANSGGQEGWTIWIGARIWPTAHALARGGINGAEDSSVLARTLLIDPATPADRLWAIDAALRAPNLVVVADGSSLNTAATRRLQLAAESGEMRGAVGLLARPPHELSSLSVASTRWRVRHAPAPPGAEIGPNGPRWEVQLVRCKGAPAFFTDGRSVVLERNDAGSVVVVSPNLGERSGRAAVAS